MSNMQAVHSPMAAIYRDSACSFLVNRTIMLFYILVVAPAFIITLHAHICNAEPNLCDRSFNYTEGSEFESNLNTVFNSLIQNTSQNGFNTSVYGQSPDQIYGLLNCRGDATADQCHNCSLAATAAIRRSENCGNGVGGIIWMDLCFLRYENYSFFGQLSTTYAGIDVSMDSNTSEPQVIGKLLSNLSTEAESRSTLYSSGIAIDSLSRKIYGLVQCWRDISSVDCTTCLSTKINVILESYPGSPYVHSFMANCMVIYQMSPFFNSSASPSPSCEEAPAAKSSKKMPIILGVAAGLVLVLLVGLFLYRRRLKSAIFRSRPSEDNKHVEEDAVVNQDRQIVFTMKALIAATGNFHDDNKLGEGGFGPVYKGTTPDGKEIAVKKLSLKSLQGKREFLNEVQLVAKIQHRNLVNLLGCCAEGCEKLLVYEYLPNKSLDKILFYPNKYKQLDWQQRYNIIMGVARGLLYLHQDSQLRIIHRDIKASNILLDKKLNPKIADFGLAKLFPEDESHVSTRVAGTCGYMAPEYALQGQLSVKADVYSFGVLLLEIITGRKNREYNLQSSETEILLGSVWEVYKQGDIMQMIDPAIIETCDEEQALRCIHVGLLCTQEDPSLRPEMSTVNLMLSSHSVTLPNPTKPAFVWSHASQNANSTSFGHVSSHSPVIAPPSNADDSITELEPR